MLNPGEIYFQKAKSFLLFLWLLPIFSSCAPSTPLEFLEYGKELLSNKQHKKAKEAFLKGFLLKNGKAIGKLPASKIFNLRLIKQNGNLAVLISKRDKIEINYYDLSSKLHTSSNSASKDNVKKHSYILDQKIVLNPSIGPGPIISFYSKKKGSNASYIYYRKIVPNNSERNGKIRGSINDNDIEQRGSFIKGKDLNNRNDILFWKKDSEIQIGYYQKGILKGYNTSSKQSYNFLDYRVIHPPYPKIGGFLKSFSGPSWQEWGFLLGGGGAYKFYRISISASKEQKLNQIKTLRFISSSDIIISGDLKKMIFYRGGSGMRYRYLNNLDNNKLKRIQNSPSKLIPKKNVGPLPEKLIFKNNKCTDKNSNYIALFNDQNIVIHCPGFYYLMDLQKELNKSPKLNRGKIIPIIGRNLIIDEYRNRFFTIVGNEVYMFHLDLLKNPDLTSLRFFFLYKTIETQSK